MSMINNFFQLRDLRYAVYKSDKPVFIIGSRNGMRWHRRRGIFEYNREQTAKSCVMALKSVHVRCISSSVMLRHECGFICMREIFGRYGIWSTKLRAARGVR
jgi:hypothetical protein